MFPHPVCRLARSAAIPLDRRRLLGFALLASIPLSAHGADLPNSGPPAAVARFCDALLAAMKAGRAVGFQRRFAILQPVVDQVFDLQTVLAVSVGPRWTGLSSDQQDRLFQAFRRYTVASYVANFDNYAGQVFAVSPDTRTVSADQVVVPTRIVPVDGDATKLDYVLKQTGSDWRIVDVLAGGSISRVAVQRSDFRGLLASGGGDALLVSLRRKTADLSGGNLA